MTRKRYRFLLLLVPIAVAAAWWLAPGTSQAAWRPAGVKDPVCLGCHADRALTRASHQVLVATIPDGSCEACHGPATEHAGDPESKRMLAAKSPSEKAALCLDCHRSGPDHVTKWAGSAFAKQGQTCSDCHEFHVPSSAHLEFAADSRGYIGDDSCRMCHPPVFAAFGGSFHAGVIDKPGGGCEACHGPAKDHAGAAGDHVRSGAPLNMVREPGASACLTCHRAVPDRHRREMSTYGEKPLACTVCHDAHVSRSDPLFADAGPAPLKDQRAGNASCDTCHVSAVASAKASVHAGLLGTDGCESCHGAALAHVKSGGRSRFVVNPEKQTPAQANALCLGCHGEAPDHARDWAGGPLEKQGLSCLTCHLAHGDAASQGKPALPAGIDAVEGRNVGSETCAICHEDPHPGIERSAHARLVSDPSEAGCESCHGPGSAHVLKGGAKDAIRNPSNLPKEQASEFCLECHKHAPNRFSWYRSRHSAGGLTCTQCHDPLKSEEETARKSEPELCYVCHQNVRAQFNLPNHHPLERGAVACTDCHDPHSNQHGFLALSVRKEKCIECHTDKRGPFLHEHEADRTEGCVVCHRPHGSTTRRLLTHNNVRSLCIQCHSTPASHNLASGSVFRNCLNCHGSIHGSYIDKRFFR